VHQRVDILQAFLVNDTRRKIYCKNTLRSQRVKDVDSVGPCDRVKKKKRNWTELWESNVDALLYDWVSSRRFE